MRFTTKSFLWLAAACGAFLLPSCANRGQGPQGGPKDETPPVVKKAEPVNGSVNVPLDIKAIVIEFDENITIDDAYNNVVFSPPFENRPEVKGSSKRLKVSFADSLRPNTTYTIDFGNAITDYNESNVLKDYVFTFSTGPSIDSLRVSGTVIDARTLAPQKGVSVGIYSGLSDSAFLTKPFERMAKTREDGSFVIYGIGEGGYSLFAVNDAMQTHRYSQPGSAIAFFDSIIHPEMHLHGRVDTLSRDTAGNGGGVYGATPFAEYYPRDIILKTFSETRKTEYFKRASRPTRQKFVLTFGSEPSQEPEISLLSLSDSSLVDAPRWYVKEKPERRDSLTYWILDSLTLASDTMLIKLDYLMSDSAYALVPASDTLRLAVPKRRQRRRRGEEEKAEAAAGPVFMEIGSNASSSLQVYDTLRFTFAEPLDSIYYGGFSLQLAVDDSTWVPVPLTFAVDDSACLRSVRLFYKKEYGSNYKVNLDSASVKSIYGKINDVYYKTYRLMALEEYSNLNVRLTAPAPDAIVELMDKNEKVIAASVYDPETGAYPFQDIKPGDYLLRMFIDANHNGRWDEGSLAERRQPEMVYYYPKILTLRANWDVEEEWPFLNLPVLEQRVK